MHLATCQGIRLLKVHLHPSAQARVSIRLAFLAGLTFPALLSAHHGTAGYNMAAGVELTATVTGFDWSNPHSLISFESKNGTGGIEKWTAETAAPVILVRAGWDKNSLKPGDQVTIVGHRAVNGTNSMILQRVVLSGGRELSNFVPR